MSRSLISRAFAAYFRSCECDPLGIVIPQQPSNESGVRVVNGRRYVHLFNVRGTLAVYRIENCGRLKRLKRWPKELEDEHECAPLVSNGVQN